MLRVKTVLPLLVGVGFVSLIVGLFMKDLNKSKEADVAAKSESEIQREKPNPGWGVTAHRGNSHRYSENTITAVASAIALGVDWVEVDVRLSSDGRMVVIHDGSTRRVGNTNLKISTNTYEDLKQVLLVNSGEQEFEPLEGPAEHIPELKEIFALIAAQEVTKLSVQPKSEVVKQVIDLAKNMGVLHKIGFNDISFRKMEQVKSIDKNIPVFWDRHPFTIISWDIDKARDAGFECLIIHKSRANVNIVKHAHQEGLEIGVWTVNDPGEMKQYLKMGFDRMYTDDPETLISIHGI